MPARRALFLFVVLTIGGCTQANVAVSPSDATTGQPVDQQQVQAAGRACALRVLGAMRSASDFHARQLAMSEGMAQCQKELRPMQAAINDRMLAQQPSIYAQTMRASLAIHSAAAAGDEPRAFQLARAMDSQSSAIESAARADPAHARDMRDMLGFAETQIGIGYEKSGNDAEAAVYYQKAIDTMGVVNGVGAPAQTRLGFLYANGRGVPRDQAKALALFGEANGEVPGARGRTETAYAYLLNHGKLPYRIEDMRPGMLHSAEDEEARRQAQIMAAAMAAGAAAGALQGRPAEPAPEKHDPDPILCHLAVKNAPSIAGMAGCPLWSW